MIQTGSFSLSINSNSLYNLGFGILVNRSSRTAFRMRFNVCRPTVKPNRRSKRIARRIRVGSSTNDREWSTRMTFSLMSRWAPKKSITSPNPSGESRTARVLMTKSRRYMSCLRELYSTVGSAAGLR